MEDHAMIDPQQGTDDPSQITPPGNMVFDGSMNQISSKKQRPRSLEEKHLSKLRRKHGWKTCELHKRQKKFCPCNIPVEWLEGIAGDPAESSWRAPAATAESIERPCSADPDRQRGDFRTTEVRPTQGLESISFASIDSTQEHIPCENDSHWQGDTSVRGPASESHFPHDDDQSPRMRTLSEHVCIHKEYQEPSGVRQGPSVGRPYDNGYFLDLVHQVGRPAAQLSEAPISEQETSIFEYTSTMSASGHSMAVSIDDCLSPMDTESNNDGPERGSEFKNDVDKHVNEWLLERAEGSTFEYFLQESVTGEFVQGSPRVKKNTQCDSCGTENPSPHDSTKLECGHQMCHNCSRQSSGISVNNTTRMPLLCCSAKPVHGPLLESPSDDGFQSRWTPKFEDWNTRAASRTTLMARYRPSGMFDSPARSHSNHPFMARINSHLRRIGREKERKICIPPANARFVRIEKTPFGHLPRDGSLPSVAFRMRQFSLRDKSNQRPIGLGTREQQDGQEGADLYREELAVVTDMKAIGRGSPARENAADFPNVEEPAQALESSRRGDTGHEELQGALTVMDEDVERMRATLPQDSALLDGAIIQDYGTIGSAIPQPVEPAEAVTHEHMRSSEDPYLFEQGEDVEMELLIVRLEPAVFGREQLAIERIVKIIDVVDPSAPLDSDSTNELDTKGTAEKDLKERIPTGKPQPMVRIKLAVCGQNTTAILDQGCKRRGNTSMPKQKADHLTTNVISATHEPCLGGAMSYNSVQHPRLLIVLLLYLTDTCALSDLQGQIRRLVGKSRGLTFVVGRLHWRYIWQDLVVRLSLVSFVLSCILNCLRKGRGRRSLMFFDGGQA